MSNRAANSNDPVGIGLIGLGTIGVGVAKVLSTNAGVIEKRLGFPLRLVRIADLDTETDRGIDLGDTRFDSDSDGLIADPNVDIVIELIGGYDVARRITLAAIDAGKHVVTANKALLALHGSEIFEAAKAKGVDVAFEASVGGGIPILRSLREGLAANEISSVLGILNGTTNYVLTEMESTGEAFDVVLKRAQDLGYAEADPTFDVEGIDAAHKLALLAQMAFGVRVDFKQIPTEGIRGLLPLDFEAASEFGYRIKLLAIAKRSSDGGSLDARVHPTLVPKDSMLAAVDGAMNAVAIRGDAVGRTLYYGAGAGEMPTASAVVGDLIEIAREIRRGNSGRVAPLSYPHGELEEISVAPLSDLNAHYYLRFTAVDRPGVLSHVTGALGEEGIGIESVLQRDRGEAGEGVPVLVYTHPTREAAVRRAIEHIDGLPDVTAATRMIRVEDDL
jgi:homoserine dehydrogenase